MPSSYGTGFARMRSFASPSTGVLYGFGEFSLQRPPGPGRGGTEEPVNIERSGGGTEEPVHIKRRGGWESG